MNLRHALGVIALVGCFAANAAGTYRTNTVEGLIYLLANHNSTGDVIELEAGDYQMPDEPTYTAPAGSSSYGKSSIHVVKQTIRGLGTTPAAVRLIGSGRHRVVYGDATSTLENLTITGGYTDDSEKSTYGNSVRCAGYYGNGILTNCIITGNSAYHLGGGVHGGVKLYNCIVENNTARNSGGGGGHNLTAYNTIFRNNTASSDGGGVYTANLYDCVLTNNTASGNNGGGGHDVKYATNTLFACNSAHNDGGGVEIATRLYDCVVSNNVAGRRGGGGYNVKYATNTVFIGNSAKMGGGVANISTQLLDGYLLDGCVISNNVTTGLAGDGAGGGLYCHVARNCIITSNRGTVGGGTYRCLLTNCTISCNVAWTNIKVTVQSGDPAACFHTGGGDYNSSLFGCTIEGNRGYGNGGGVCCDDAAVVVSNCVIAANTCSNAAAIVYGAGICVENGTVVNCTIRGNAAFKVVTAKGANGGGIASSLGLGRGDVRNCILHDNYAESSGGGAHNMRLVDCVISNNLSGGTGNNTCYSHLYGGEVVGTPLAFGSATGVDFHGFNAEFSLEGNPYRSDTVTIDKVYHYYPHCTNCLFRDNQLTNASLFVGYSVSASTSSVVNCTIVSNQYRYLCSGFPNEDYPMNIENCIFYDNFYKTTARDLFTYNCNTSSLHFSHCAYGTSALAGNTIDWFDEGHYQFGVNGIPATPGFAGAKDPAHPYALRTSSGLLGLARVADWMADAYDIRGEADDGKYRRLRDGKADLGCYQCWYDFIGTKVFIR